MLKAGEQHNLTQPACLWAGFPDAGQADGQGWGEGESRWLQRLSGPSRLRHPADDDHNLQIVTESTVRKKASCGRGHRARLTFRFLQLMLPGVNQVGGWRKPAFQPPTGMETVVQLALSTLSQSSVAGSTRTQRCKLYCKTGLSYVTTRTVLFPSYWKRTELP